MSKDTDKDTDMKVEGCRYCGEIIEAEASHIDAEVTNHEVDCEHNPMNQYPNGNLKDEEDDDYA